MSNYTKTTDFTFKDSLPTTNPAKIIHGYEHDVELDAIEAAIPTKAEANPTKRVETLTETTVLTAADSGKTYFLDSATGFGITLPAEAAGLSFKFIVKQVPASLDYTIGAFSLAVADRFSIQANYLAVTTGSDHWYDSSANRAVFERPSMSVGDWLYFTSSASRFYATGQSRLDGGIDSATVIS